MEKELKIRINGDLDGLKKAIDESISEVGRLTSSQERAKQGLAQLNAEALKLTGSIRDLNRNFQAGKISNEQFKVEHGKLTEALRKNRHETLLYNREIDRLSKQIARAKAAAEAKTLAVQKDTVQVKQNEQAVTRNAYAQRAAASASNSLARSFISVASGSGSAAASLGAATRQMATATATAGGLTAGLRALWTSLLGPAGVAIAVSAAVTALTSWITNSVSAKKESEDLASSLDTVSTALHNASRSYGENIARMDTLLAITRDSTVSLKERQAALDELQSMYPAVFNNFNTETILTKEATDAYNNLTKSIVAASNARAAEGLLAERASDQFKLVLENSARQKQIEALKESIKLQKEDLETRKSIDLTVQETYDRQRRLSRDQRELNKLQKESTATAEEISRLAGDRNTLAEMAVNYQKQVNSELLKGNEATKKVTEETDKFAAALERIESDLRTKFKEGRDRELEEAQLRYENLLALAEGNADKIAQAETVKRELISKINSKWDAIEAEAAEKGQEIIRLQQEKHLKAVEDIIQKNRDRIAILSKEGRERELEELRRQYEAMYEMEGVTAESRLVLVDQYEQERARIINEWNRRELDEQKKTQDQFNQLVAQQSRTLSRNLAGAFESIVLDGENAFKTLGDSFKKMVVRMLAEAAALKVISALFGAITLGSGGGIGGLLLGVLTGGRSFSSSAPSSSFIGSTSPGGINISSPLVASGTADRAIFIPEVKVSGSDLLLVFNRANTRNQIYGGGR